MEKRRIIIASILLFGILIAGSFIYSASLSKLATIDEKKIGVVVTIPPEAEFVENVGGDRVTVTVMVPQGANPHTYEPLPEQLKNVSGAKMYAYTGSGIEFENIWIDKISSMNKNMIMINCSNGIKFIPNSDIDEAHENEYDTHVWVSPRNAKIMVENIYQGLVQVDPANKDYYKANRNKYLHELDESDKKINESLEGDKNKEIMVYHPAWGYFCNDYGLTQIAIEKNGKEPTPQGITSLIDQAKKENIKIIFISPQFSKISAETIASEIGGRVVTIDDLDKNYLYNLDNVANAFQNSFKE